VNPITFPLDAGRFAGWIPAIGQRGAYASFALASALLLLAPRTSPAAAEPVSAVAPAVDRFLAPLVTDREFSGAVLVSRGDDVLAERAYGLANVEHAVSSTTSTRYAIGSLSKSVTAAAILILEDRHKLSLSDPVARFVPGLRWGDRVTIEQLLSHTAGVPDYYLFPEYFARRFQPISPGEMVSLLSEKPLDFEPGSKSSYSNSGYALLAAVIERASGVRYSEFLRTAVFEPLAMKSSGDLAVSGLTENLATGYNPGFDPERLQRPVSVDASWLIGSGSLYSTVEDLRRFAEAMRKGTLVAISGKRYPYGWGRRKDGDREFWEQNGRIPLGFVSYLSIHPEEDLVVVVLGNVQVDLAERIGHALTAMAFGKSPEAIPGHRGTTLSARAIEGLAGRYQIAPGFVLTVRAEGDRLSLAGPEGDFSPLLPEAPTRFFYRLLWVPVTFALDAQGRGTSLDWAGQFTASRLKE